MSGHVHGSPSAECTYEKKYGIPCPFPDRRFWPVNVCWDCGKHKRHLEGCLAVQAIRGSGL